MALSSLVRRASSSVNTSIRSRRCYQNQISLLNIENSFSVGGQFLPFETSGNSLVHGFVRRAYSSIAPLSIRSLGSRRPYQTQISPLGGQFLPCVRFSTLTDDNISIPIESNNNIRDSSNVIRIPDAFPFCIEHNNESLHLVKRNKHEAIQLTVFRDTYEESGGPPKVSMTGHIIGQFMVTEFETTVEPNRIIIHSFKRRPNGMPDGVPYFGKYLGTKGINDGMVHRLLNYFRK